SSPGCLMDSPARCLLRCSSVRICGFRPGKHSRSCSAFRPTQTVPSAFSVWNHSATQASRCLACSMNPVLPVSNLVIASARADRVPKPFWFTTWGAGHLTLRLSRWMKMCTTSLLPKGSRRSAVMTSTRSLPSKAVEVEGIDQKTRENLTAAAWFRLLEECRHKKEALNPNSRRITIDLEHAHPG